MIFTLDAACCILNPPEHCGPIIRVSNDIGKRITWTGCALDQAIYDNRTALATQLYNKSILDIFYSFVKMLSINIVSLGRLGTQDCKESLQMVVCTP